MLAIYIYYKNGKSAQPVLQSMQSMQSMQLFRKLNLPTIN